MPAVNGESNRARSQTLAKPRYSLKNHFIPVDPKRGDHP